MILEGEEVTAKVYCLKHNNEPFYVGCTTQSLGERLREHYTSSALPNVFDFLSTNKGVVIELIEDVKYKYDKRFQHRIGVMYEDYWIKEYKKRGYNLLNAKQINEAKFPIRKTLKDAPKLGRETDSQIEYLPVKIKSIISYNLRNARKSNGLTQESAANAIGIKRSLLGAYEEARAEPSIPRLKIICNVYGIQDVISFATHPLKFTSLLQKTA